MRFSRRVLATYGILSAVIVLLILTAKNSKIHRHNPRMRITKLMGSLNWTELVKPGEDTILLEPSSSRLNRVNGSSRPFAVILVTSLPVAAVQRQAVRDSWGKWAEGLDMRVYFTMGFSHLNNKTLWESLESEQKTHDDLVVDNFEEGYYRLTGKMLRMLKWYSATYSDELSPRFLIKTDHDVFLNLPNIATILRDTPYYKRVLSLRNPEGSIRFDPANPHSYFMGGKRFNNSKPDPEPESKWHLSSAEMKILRWNRSVYPEYANGACYVISGNAVKPIYTASASVPIFPFEDAYLTGLVAHEGLNLSITHMSNLWDYEEMWRWDELKIMLVMHPVDSPALMSEIMEKVETSKNAISKSTQIPADSWLVLTIISFIVAVGL